MPIPHNHIRYCDQFLPAQLLFFYSMFGTFGSRQSRNGLRSPEMPLRRNRWPNRDPISQTDVPIERFKGANLYAYVNNDGVGNVDAFGLMPIQKPPPGTCPPRRPQPPPTPPKCGLPCSKSGCQNTADNLYSKCSSGCAADCVPVGLEFGPLTYALCFGDCNAGCAADWAIQQGLCQPCRNP
jgi:hypothetical protein